MMPLFNRQSPTPTPCAHGWPMASSLLSFNLNGIANHQYISWSNFTETFMQRNLWNFSFKLFSNCSRNVLGTSKSTPFQYRNYLILGTVSIWISSQTINLHALSHLQSVPGTFSEQQTIWLSWCLWSGKSNLFLTWLYSIGNSQQNHTDLIDGKDAYSVSADNILVVGDCLRGFWWRRRRIAGYQFCTWCQNIMGARRPYYIACCSRCVSMSFSCTSSDLPVFSQIFKSGGVG